MLRRMKIPICFNSLILLSTLFLQTSSQDASNTYGIVVKLNEADIPILKSDAKYILCINRRKLDTYKSSQNIENLPKPYICNQDDFTSTNSNNVLELWQVAWSLTRLGNFKDNSVDILQTAFPVLDEDKHLYLGSTQDMLKGPLIKGSTEWTETAGDVGFSTTAVDLYLLPDETQALQFHAQVPDEPPKEGNAEDGKEEGNEGDEETPENEENNEEDKEGEENEDDTEDDSNEKLKVKRQENDVENKLENQLLALQIWRRAASETEDDKLSPENYPAYVYYACQDPDPNVTDVYLMLDYVPGATASEGRNRTGCQSVELQAFKNYVEVPQDQFKREYRVQWPTSESEPPTTTQPALTTVTQTLVCQQEISTGTIVSSGQPGEVKGEQEPEESREENADKEDNEGTTEKKDETDGDEDKNSSDEEKERSEKKEKGTNKSTPTTSSAEKAPTWSKIAASGLRDTIGSHFNGN